MGGGVAAAGADGVAAAAVRDGRADRTSADHDCDGHHLCLVWRGDFVRLLQAHRGYRGKYRQSMDDTIDAGCLLSRAKSISALASLVSAHLVNLLYFFSPV